MRFLFEKGLVCKNGVSKLLIDPHSAKQKQHPAVFTHAHSDHFANGHTTSLMTPPTEALLSNRHAKLTKSRTVEFGKKIKMENAQVSLHNAGHILGSGQVLIHSDQTALITSDFNPVDSILLPAAQPQSCDTLVIESTFGLPEFSFPKREDVHEQIGTWIQQHAKAGRFVVLAGYSLGKSQELTRIVNDYAGIAPLVHEQIFRHNKTYEQFGIRLGKYIQLDHNLKESGVLILPPSLFDKHLTIALEFELKKKVVTALATGWGYKGGFDQVFSLSDHADYAGLLGFVKACAPKQVYTMHGYAREFAHAISRRLRIPARSIEDAGQAALFEFQNG